MPSYACLEDEDKQGILKQRERDKSILGFLLVLFKRCVTFTVKEMNT